MRLVRRLVRLPLRSHAERLAEEVAAIDPSAWRPHPQGLVGNDALLLVSRDGDPTNDDTKGVMAPTPHLEELPYVRAVMGSLGAPIGRSRLMRLEPAAEATAHVDVNHYWLERLRVHVPIVTDPTVEFLVGDQAGHMAPGETWVFDTWSNHAVRNRSVAPRIHLVMDTVGSASLWDLIDHPDRPDRWIEPEDDAPPVFETVNRATVMSPWELDHLISLVMADVAPADAESLRSRLRDLVRDWRSQWAASGSDRHSLPAYGELAAAAKTDLEPWKGRLSLSNGLDLAGTLSGSILDAAIDRSEARRVRMAPSTPKGSPVAATTPVGSRIIDPVIIVSPPRSGSTLLYEVLSGSPDAWSLQLESHEVIEGIVGLHPRDRAWTSNRLTAEDATPERVTALHERFVQRVVGRDGARPASDQRIRLLEKTPKNALRVPFLAEAFPDARFVFLYRDPLDAIASMLEGWRSGRFVMYPELPGWSGPDWSFVLVPGWEDLAAKPLVEIVAQQWKTTMDHLLDDLTSLPAERWVVSGYGPLVRDPAAEVGRLCSTLGLAWDRPIEGPLPLSATTLSPPGLAKREAVRDELAKIVDVVSETAERAREVFAHPPGPSRRRTSAPLSLASASRAAPSASASKDPMAEVERDPGFTSEATGSFVDLLVRTGSSLLVSTYQSRRLIVLRALDGSINTHFLAFESPMGIAARGPDLALAAGRAVWRFRDRPAVLHRLTPPDRHDACYVPRSAHITGDLRSHDLAYGDEGLWVVATLFSCLATIDEEHSFVPRWRPKFISAIAAEDRCHLNGLAMVDGRPGFVTCFGATDEAGGWRKDGGATKNGMVIDVATSEPVATGLCMPHSPRWYDGRLWLLESGRGALCVLDSRTGAIEEVTRLPGFTRGLTFLGPYALVGLSLVRETVFDGVPIKEGERSCGVWAVDTRTGKTAGWLRFSGAVQELYDVQSLPGRAFPTVLEPEDTLTARSFVLPDEVLGEVAR